MKKISNRKTFDPLKLFTDNAFAARLWFFVALVLLGYVVIQPFFIIQACKQREAVVIMDAAGTYSIAPALSFDEAKELHQSVALLASQALFSKYSMGFDYPELLERLFLKESYEKVIQEGQAMAEEFSEKNIHQKQQIFSLKILKTRNDTLIAQMKGELIRYGVFQEEAFTEAIPFKLNLKLVRNPDMLTNKRYPLVVFDYEWGVSA